MDEKLRVSKDDLRRISSKLSDLEAEKAGMERQAENDADVTTERVRAAGKRITELQGKRERERSGPCFFIRFIMLFLFFSRFRILLLRVRHLFCRFFFADFCKNNKCYPFPNQFFVFDSEAVKK